MTINEILIVVALIFIVADIFVASDIPTHIAYVLLTFTITKELNLNILYQLLFGILIWFALVIFHYTIWRKVIEKINDRFIAPNKHIAGLEGFIGQEGIIKEIEGKKFFFINDEIHQFETDKKIVVGNTYRVIKIKSNKLII
jgi:membrane protein implicated in regulation of membrane protease activity